MRKKEVKKNVFFVDKEKKELFIFTINEKDSKLFNQAKKDSEDVYFLIENLEFLQVDFEIVGW